MRALDPEVVNVLWWTFSRWSYDRKGPTRWDAIAHEFLLRRNRR